MWRKVQSQQPIMRHNGSTGMWTTAMHVYVQEFYDHLNSINPHIQFTKEAAENHCLSFLDTDHKSE